MRGMKATQPYLERPKLFSCQQKKQVGNTNNQWVQEGPREVNAQQAASTWEVIYLTSKQGWLGCRHGRGETTRGKAVILHPTSRQIAPASEVTSFSASPNVSVFSNADICRRRNKSIQRLLCSERHVTPKKVNDTARFTLFTPMELR